MHSRSQMDCPVTGRCFFIGKWSVPWRDDAFLPENALSCVGTVLSHLNMVCPVVGRSFFARGRFILATLQYVWRTKLHLPVCRRPVFVVGSTFRFVQNVSLRWACVYLLLNEAACFNKLLISGFLLSKVRNDFSIFQKNFWTFFKKDEGLNYLSSDRNSLSQKIFLDMGREKGEKTSDLTTNMFYKGVFI